jgi:hypothetical protein
VEQKNTISKKWVLSLVIILSLSVIVVMQSHAVASVEEKRAHFIELKEDIQQTMKEELGYRCCLETPCVYCIEKTPGHGEGAVCDCLADIVNGVHPCGECIGEILEGHGNPLLAEYFATAIAEEVGEQHLSMLKRIISEKYDIPVDEQV